MFEGAISSATQTYSKLFLSWKPPTNKVADSNLPLSFVHALGTNGTDPFLVWIHLIHQSSTPRSSKKHPFHKPSHHSITHPPGALLPGNLNRLFIDGEFNWMNHILILAKWFFHSDQTSIHLKSKTTWCFEFSRVFPDSESPSFWKPQIPDPRSASTALGFCTNLLQGGTNLTLRLLESLVTTARHLIEDWGCPVIRYNLRDQPTETDLRSSKNGVFS